MEMFPEKHSTASQCTNWFNCLAWNLYYKYNYLNNGCLFFYFIRLAFISSIGYMFIILLSYIIFKFRNI